MGATLHTLEGTSMSYFNRCPYCGCHLDPNEKCDCGRSDKTDELFSQDRKQTAQEIEQYRLQKAAGAEEIQLSF